MLDFKHMKFSFPPTTGRAQSATQAAVFSSAVNRADAALNGFDIGFAPSDHPLLREQIDVATAVVDNTVNVTVGFALRDNSGQFDDPYNGWVDVLVIVDRAETTGSVLQSGDRVALRADDGHFVCAEKGGGHEMVANRNAVGPWERFTIEKA